MSFSSYLKKARARLVKRLMIMFRNFMRTCERGIRWEVRKEKWRQRLFVWMLLRVVAVMFQPADALCFSVDPMHRATSGSSVHHHMHADWLFEARAKVARYWYQHCYQFLWDDFWSSCQTGRLYVRVNLEGEINEVHMRRALPRLIIKVAAWGISMSNLSCAVVTLSWREVKLRFQKESSYIVDCVDEDFLLSSRFDHPNKWESGDGFWEKRQSLPWKNQQVKLLGCRLSNFLSCSRTSWWCFKISSRMRSKRPSSSNSAIFKRKTQKTVFVIRRLGFQPER